MSATPASATPPPPSSRARRLARRALWTLGALLLGLCVLVAGLVWFAASESALAPAARQLARMSGGRLSIEGARGSLLSSMTIGELRWHDDSITLVAQDVIVEWQPRALLRRELHVDTLGARRLELHVAPAAQGGAAAPPGSLALPLAVVVEHAGVTTLDWQLGERSGRVTGIAFAYRGGASAHRFDDVMLAFERGRVGGSLELGAAAPFAVAGNIAFTGSDTLAGASASSTLAGTLARIAVSADGHVDAAHFSARAALTPFAAAALDTLDIDAGQVDLAALGPQWPHTSLALRVHARPAPDGFAGDLEASNAGAGPIDQDRLPLAAMTAHYSQSGERLLLHDVDLTIAGGGAAHGEATIDLAKRSVDATLALDRIDLHALHGALVPTQISGRMRAAGGADAQVLDGDVADRARGLALAFDARIAGGRLTLPRARLTAAGGTLDGSATLAFAGAREFELTARATHFDPSRLGAFPQGSLEGDLRVAGRLEPTWSARAEVRLTPGARLADVAVGGSARANLAPGSVRDLDANLTLGDASFAASGDAGRVGDRIAYKLDVPALAHIAPLLPAAARARDGRVAASGTLAVEPGGVGGAISAKASGLAFAGDVRVGSVTLEANVDAPGGAQRRTAFAERNLAIDVDATGIASATHEIAHAHLAARGKLAAHELRLELANADDKLSLGAHGALDDSAAALAWRGMLDTLALHGNVDVDLVAPAHLEASAHHVRLGAATLTFAQGRMSIDDLALDDGRVSTHGAFDGVSVAAVAQLLRRPLPMPATLLVAGNWSLAATPRLNGSVDLHAARGDIYVDELDAQPGAERGLGIRKLALAAAVHDDAWTLDAAFDSLRAGSATLAATLAAGATPGVPSLDAALTAKLDAELASLAPLQPWLGTAAVADGRAELHLAASGTLRAPDVTGRLQADRLRIDAPQWGIALADGRVRATLAERVVTLDEFTFSGGDGRFSASGTLARATSDEGARVTWHAERFRLINVPELRMVVSGEGTVTTAPRRLAVNGKLTLDEGAIVYAPRTPLLGDDVVIKGRPRGDAGRESARLRALALDLTVDLGKNTTFNGIGLEAGLGGRVRVTTSDDGTLRGNGTIRATRGTYVVFGQKLTLDRGTLIFDGPLDNPALDIVALRRNLPVEAGVELTGTVRVPRARLTSNPPVPDGDKLSWLITGAPSGSGNAADAAALAAASSFLLGNYAPPVGTTIARQLGFDDITLRSTETGTSSSAATNQVVAVSKRLSDRLTLVYEQGLTIATNALRLEYTLNRFVSLRVETGTASAVGVFYRRSFN